MPPITNSKNLIMATHGFEESELLKPLEELGSKGAIVHVASPEVGEIKGWWHKDWGKFVPSISRSMPSSPRSSRRWRRVRTSAGSDAMLHARSRHPAGNVSLGGAFG